jgi:uncharacterized protein YodC (DUF2158 family)
VQDEYTFGEGDLVQLRTGGPVMTVRFPVEQFVLCAWMDASGRERRATFSRDQLRIARTAFPIWLTATARLASRWPVVAAF